MLDINRLLLPYVVPGIIGLLAIHLLKGPNAILTS